MFTDANSRGNENATVWTIAVAFAGLLASLPRLVVVGLLCLLVGRS